MARILNQMGETGALGADRLQQDLQSARERLKTDPTSAAALAKEIIRRHPRATKAYRLLGEALLRLGHNEEAERASHEAIRISIRSPLLVEAAGSMLDRRFEHAEKLIRSSLQIDSDDAEALRLLADIAATAGHNDDAEHLLRRAIEIAPAFVAAYVNLSTLFQKLGRSNEALALLSRIAAREPRYHWALSLKAAILVAERRMGEALQTHEELLARVPEAAIAWMNYGYALKTVGRIDEAVAAYRRSLQLDSASGFAWWGLANLKTIKLDASDVQGMQAALQQAADDVHRIQLHFALGKGFADQGAHEQSFAHYSAGNELRRHRGRYEPELVTKAVGKIEEVFSVEFLRKYAGSGCGAVDPIFVVGMPRAGSSLVEQILACHPLIEGAGELPELEGIAARIGGGSAAGSLWLEEIAERPAESLRELGEIYLSSVEKHRTSECPFFTDKMPHNWRFVGLILLILPNAKIIDVRRHPLGCCLSNFSMYFNQQTSFPSSLEHLGSYYCDYVRMMDHFERILPGRIYRVTYEKLVDNSNHEIRRLLHYLGVPFDEACLRFYENPRPVYTPSTQQVRMPINREGLDHWRSYEAWLGPLREALGPVLDYYPNVPSKRSN